LTKGLEFTVSSGSEDEYSELLTSIGHGISQAGHKFAASRCENDAEPMRWIHRGFKGISSTGDYTIFLGTRITSNLSFST